MKKRNRKNTHNAIIRYIPFLVGIVFVLIGGVILLCNESIYTGAKLECDNKDYSSYITKMRIETTASKNIKQQINLYKSAMDSAAKANDASAYGQLLKEYNELLELQAKTTEYETHYDYTKVNQAKQDCLDAAQSQKTTRFSIGLGLAIIGIVVTIFGLIIPILVKKTNRKKSPKIH